MDFRAFSRSVLQVLTAFKDPPVGHEQQTVIQLVQDIEAAGLIQGFGCHALQHIIVRGMSLLVPGNLV